MNSVNATAWSRRAAVAGKFYPAAAPQLERMVRGLLDQASVPDALHVRGLLAPHAGYPCSGRAAAHSFKPLLGAAGADQTVYLLGPAHWLPVEGAGLTSAHSFATPLGLVPVAVSRVQRLLKLGEPYHLADAAHELDHCLEVELPFLQVVLARFQIVPMLLDQQADPGQIARDLAGLLEEEASLLVASSDLSHGLPYAAATRTDRAFLAALAAGDVDAVARGQACGLLPICCLMQVARYFGWQPHLLDYCNSGDTCGPKTGVVGYGSAVYSDAPVVSTGK